MKTNLKKILTVIILINTFAMPFTVFLVYAEGFNQGYSAGSKYAFGSSEASVGAGLGTAGTTIKTLKTKN